MNICLVIETCVLGIRAPIHKRDSFILTFYISTRLCPACAIIAASLSIHNDSAQRFVSPLSAPFLWQKSVYENKVGPGAFTRPKSQPTARTNDDVIYNYSKYNNTNAIRSATHCWSWTQILAVFVIFFANGVAWAHQKGALVSFISSMFRALAGLRRLRCYGQWCKQPRYHYHRHNSLINGLEIHQKLSGGTQTQCIYMCIPTPFYGIVHKHTHTSNNWVNHKHENI